MLKDCYGVTMQLTTTELHTRSRELSQHLRSDGEAELMFHRRVYAHVVPHDLWKRMKAALAEKEGESGHASQ